MELVSWHIDKTFCTSISVRLNKTYSFERQTDFVAMSTDTEYVTVIVST